MTNLEWRVGQLEKKLEAEYKDSYNVMMDNLKMLVAIIDANIDGVNMNSTQELERIRTCLVEGIIEEEAKNEIH